MTHFSFRGEFDSGRSVEFVPDFVRPLGVAELRSLHQDPETAIELQLGAGDLLVDGEKQPGHARVKTKITFSEPPIIFALVGGGWLPLPFAMPPRFLVDRNVVISLRKLRLGQTVESGQALVWWTKFFEQGSALFNPLPYAFESGYRRKPTMAEFVAAYDEGVAELREALPKCEVVRFDQTHYRAAYALLEAFDRRNERETEFLLRTCTLVAERAPKRKVQEILRAIISTADQFSVVRTTPVVLAVLSCLFEDIHGDLPLIGRRVIKPKKAYTVSDAFNAISDLRHIELAAVGQTYFQDAAFALCTRDRPVALLWSALSLRGEFKTRDAVEFTFELTRDLFPRLTEAEIIELKTQLAA